MCFQLKHTLCSQTSFSSHGGRSGAQSYYICRAIYNVHVRALPWLTMASSALLPLTPSSPSSLGCSISAASCRAPYMESVSDHVRKASSPSVKMSCSEWLESWEGEGGGGGGEARVAVKYVYIYVVCLVPTRFKKKKEGV